MAQWKSAVPSREEQRDLKRSVIMREAAAAFRRFGFHNVSLDEVAKSLQISKPTLYTYFPTKQQLLFECHSLALDLGDASIDYASREGRTGLDRVVKMLDHYVRQLTGEMGEMTVLTDLHALTPEDRETIRKRRDGFDRVLRAWVREGMADGSIHKGDPTLTVMVFMGAVNWLHAWFSHGGPRGGDEIAEHFSRIFGRGIAADRPGGSGRGAPAGKPRRSARAAAGTSAAGAKSARLKRVK